jgi:hypothetical protein
MNKSQLKALTDAQIKKLLEQRDNISLRQITGWERELTDQYKLALKEIKAKIAEMYGKYGDKVTLADMEKFNRLTNLENQIKDIIKNLNRKAKQTTVNAIKDLYQLSFYRTGYALESSTGLRMGFGLLNPDVIEAAVLNTYDKITWPKRMLKHQTELLDTVKTEVTQGLIQGKGFRETAKALQARTEITASKALRIVRTESTRAQNLGNQNGYNKAYQAAERLGVGVKKIWYSALIPGKTRDNHAFMDGKAANKDGLFEFTTMSGNVIMVEGPHLTNTTDDINCLCHTGLEIEGLESSMQDERLLKMKTYNEYYQSKIRKVA